MRCIEGYLETYSDSDVARPGRWPYGCEIPTQRSLIVVLSVYVDEMYGCYIVLMLVCGSLRWSTLHDFAAKSCSLAK